MSPRALMQTLRGRLFAFLLALGGTTALAVAGATYLSVRAETDELFDYHLRQMALSLRDQGRIGEDESEVLSNPDFDYVVQIWTVQGLALYSSRPPKLALPLPPRAVMGFSEQRLGNEDWRVYAAATPLRVVQVAQPLAVRRRMAVAAALRSVLPVLVAVPIVAGGLWWLIGLSLAPLQRVAREAAARGAGSLEALTLTDLPGEIQPLVRAFNELLERLSGAFDAQRSFIADAAHELRTPLTALKLQIDLLDGARPGAELDDAVRRLRSGIERATRLVEQLLALARAEPGSAMPASDVDLRDVAQLALADAQPLAQRAGVRITLDALQPTPARGDRDALRSALRNLLDNAVKYGARTVILSVRPLGAGWSVTVDDDGPGIAPEDRARVLGRFQRATVAAAEGSGLGLAIVDAVARQHGARMTLGVAPLGGLRVELQMGSANGSTGPDGAVRAGGASPTGARGPGP